MGSIDNKTVKHGDATFQLDLEPDHDSSPHDADCYGAEDFALFTAGDWQYVTVLITPDGADAPTFVLGSVEYGYGHGFTVTLADVVERAKAEGWFDEAALAAPTEPVEPAKVTWIRDQLAAGEVVDEDDAADLLAAYDKVVAENVELHKKLKGVK